ncbi:MAG TPA: M28 family peptidase [Vicinamibacterales bacterium]|nr:M28 family peptidase [Vicinamibacterales bacterium]
MAQLLVAAPTFAQTVTTSRTRTHVETLASEKFEGRLTGSAGEKLAADYLIGELKRIGARPLPGLTDFRMPFIFTAGSKDGGTTVTLGTETPQARALSFSDSGTVDGDVVFAGYGLVVPESQNFGYDSYAGLDVKDKIVMVLRYFPEDADQKTRGILARYADLRYKAQAARQRGAKGMIVVTGPRSPNAGELVPMSFDTAIAGSGIVAVSVAGDGGMKASGRSLADVQKELDSGNPHVAGFAMKQRAQITAKIVREQQTGHNVVGYLPATTPTTAVAKPWVAIGAHYDHLGRGGAGNSLADKAQLNQVHHGADDNASGTATVLNIADALAKQPRKRNLLIGFWSGEELGLLGSNAFVTKPPVPVDQIAAYLNFDMVGRVADNKLTVQATGTSTVWPKLLEQANVAAGFDLVLQEDPYQPTDVGSFNSAGVPCLTFFTGAHQEYHKPSDTPDKINYEDLDRVGELATAIVKRLMDADDAPQFTKVEQKQDSGGRTGLRIFTGTIPDYATDVKGLLLGGVIGGGPAEQAGLQKGDVIVEIAGQSIANVYDYTYALELLKIGQPAKVVYLRGGERRETTLTPSARK